MNLTAFLPAIAGLLDRILPDPKASEQAKLELAKLASEGNLKELDAMVELTKAQAVVNAADAAGNKFQAGWRPTIGYVCAAAIAYNYIAYPFLTWVTFMWFPDVVVPDSPVDEHMWELIMGMLGLGFVRSWEKRKK